METKWVDQQSLGPYNGALFVFNFGRANYKTIPGLSQEYIDSVMKEVNSAHAKGNAVFYLFDNDIAYSLPPEEFDFLEDFDHVRPASMYGDGDLSFPLDYGAMLGRLKRLASEVFQDPKFLFDGRRSNFIGYCRIDGDRVLMPRTE